MADMNFNLKINEASKFNDVNSDGLGEFEGWGTSLCWWANRLGYNKNLINQAVDRFYSPNGLDLNIGRYNIGGGDHVKETFHTPYYIDRSNKKVVYDLRTSGLKPEYFGTNMSISSYDMSTARYTRSDSDFGITSGSTVGTIECVGYINRLDSMTSFGDNLRYRNINVTNSGRYIVKFLLALEGENNRNIAIRVNDVSKYSIDKDIINNNAIATNGNITIYLVEFDGVYLSQGVNTIDFGSNTTDWCLDVIKMAVVRSKEDDYYRDWYDVPPNKKADIYDCLDHRQSIKTGSAMGNFFLYDLYNATYSKSEANFGIQSGEVIKNLYAFNNINKLDDVADTGGNATFNVDVKEEDTYDVILMLTLEGTNDRDMAIKVNGTKYSVGADVINNNIIASANNRKMYIAPFYEIHLNRGVNAITIGGNTGWGLDFVKMCVVKTTAYGVLPENDDFLHNAHINRSDSVVPGYCTDVSKINTNEHNIEWYHKNFERVDEECGYAWNYDWNADRYQMNILKAIAKQRGEDFIAEAFSNSPPYFMTNSGCSSGANDSSKNNLRDNAYNAFAKYLADVIAHFNLRDDEVTFTSATGMNEPYTNYWGANSNKQEGCHFDQGYPQSRVIRALNWNLHDKGVHDCIVSGTDETSIDTAISSYNALDQYAKETISRIDTHSYGGSDRAGLRQLAENEGKNLWMSEVDGDFTKGTNAGEMSAPLGLAHRIIEDLMWMKPSAWILWDIVDMHCDTGNVHDGNDFNWLNQNGGYWGLTACNHDDEYIWCLKKYYAFGQFTRYIRPGHNIFPIDWNAIGSYDSKNNKVVIVAINTENSDKSAWFSFEQFGLMDTNNITAIRTSGSLNGGENWADVSSSCNIWIEKNSKWFTATLKANSITTFIVDDVYLIKPSDLNTEITIYKGLNMLTPTGVTPEAGEYKVNILDTANCTAKLESDNKTITVTSIASNEASIKVSINIENIKTYEKTISVAKIISTEVIQKTVTRQSKLEQSLNGFRTTVSETYQTRSDMGTYSTTEQINSMLEQTSRDITATFNNGYKRGITQMNAEGIKVYHNSINGENYTHMSPTGFYIKHKGTDIFKVDENGLTIQGYASDSSLKNLSDTYYNGYIRGITQINAEGVKVYHNSINGENYTHMSPTGFYIKHKGTDIFKVDENGLYVKGNGDFTGKVTANDGSIGGFTISNGKLVGTGGQGVGMSGDRTDWAFWAGSTTGGDAPFHVGHDGWVYASNATITGTITSSTIEGGTISGTTISGTTISGTTISGSIFKSGTDYNPHKQNITGLQMQDDTIYSYGTKNNGIYAVTKISGGTINIGNGEDGAGLNWSSHITSSDISLFKQGSTGYFYVGTTEAPGSGYSTTTTTIDTTTINIGSKDVTTAFKVDYNDHCEFGNNYFTRGSLTINQLSKGVSKGTQTYLTGTTISATNIYQNGSNVSGSDIILKDNIKEYEDSALDIINKTKVYSFNRILANQDKTEIGFLAQQVPDIFVFDKGEFTAEELEGLTAQEKQQLLDKKTKEHRTVLENKKLDEIADKVTSFYDLNNEQTEEQISQIIDEYKNIEYEVPISTINQNNIIAIMFKAIQELKAELDEVKKSL